MKRFFAATAMAALLAAPSFATDILWDQPVDPAQTALVDQAFGDFPDFSTYMVNDVTFGSDVVIESVTTFFTNTALTWPQGGSGSATFNVFSDPVTGADDPTLGTTVTVDFMVGADGLEVTASGLNLALSAGTYWIGLTPILDFGVFGQEFHQGSALVGANSLARNPGGGFGVGTDWVEAGPAFSGADFDGAIRITGKTSAIPEPATASLIAIGLAGLVARRRR